MRTILTAFFLGVFFFAGMHFGFILEVHQHRNFIFSEYLNLNTDAQIQKNLQARWRDKDFVENYRNSVIIEGKLELINSLLEYKPNLNDAFFEFFRKGE